MELGTVFRHMTISCKRGGIGRKAAVPAKGAKSRQIGLGFIHSNIFGLGFIHSNIFASGKDKVEEKRENFSPRKLRKPGEREREKCCWKATFSRENFSPEKTLK
jgi:hypothetical protein